MLGYIHCLEWVRYHDSHGLGVTHFPETPSLQRQQETGYVSLAKRQQETVGTGSIHIDVYIDVHIDVHIDVLLPGGTVSNARRGLLFRIYKYS